MNRKHPSSLAILGLLIVGATSANAQFGYVAQAPAGAGIAPMGMDPNMGMAMGGAAYGAPASPYVTQGAMGGMMPATGSQMLSYGNLEGRVIRNTFKDKSIDASNGLQLELMAQLFNPFFLHADFAWSGSAKTGSKTNSYNFSTIRIGGGGFFAINDRLHLMAELGGMYSSLSAKKDALSFSDGALYVNPTLRFAATEQMELQAGVLMTSADKYSSRVFELGGYWKLFSQMDLGLGLDLGNQGSSYHAGVRFRW
jgi:hypothetical protein